MAFAVAFAAVLAEDAVRSPVAATTSSALPGPIVARVDRELVDIDTVLGFGEGSAAGTGMVVTPSGEVITNNHVIEGSTSITATDVGNGRTYRVRVVGYDVPGDIAVLALEGASGLPTVAFGSTTGARVDEKVDTIGNVGGAGGTPTAAGGSIAALNQSIAVGDQFNGVEHLSGLIEIHGSLEPGDSGGPLVDASGAAIGMDTATTVDFQLRSPAGVGFAIPSNAVTAVARQIEAGRASDAIHIGATAFVGVLLSERAIAPSGALVLGVYTGTPAAAAGLSRGDLITTLDGRAVASAAGLTAALEAMHPGQRVTLSWLELDGTRQTTAIRLVSGPVA
jgi:S1-C subfamily serine protease